MPKCSEPIVKTRQNGYDQRVTVDFNKMAIALYNAGYRKGENDENR